MQLLSEHCSFYVTDRTKEPGRRTAEQPHRATTRAQTPVTEGTAMKHPLPRKLLSLLVATVLALPLAASPLTGWAEEPGCPAAGSLPEQATASPGTPGEPAKPSDENAPTSNEEVDPGEQPANDGLLPRDGNPAEPADSTPSAQPVQAHRHPARQRRALRRQRNTRRQRQCYLHRLRRSGRPPEASRSKRARSCSPSAR